MTRTRTTFSPLRPRQDAAIKGGRRKKAPSTVDLLNPQPKVAARATAADASLVQVDRFIEEKALEVAFKSTFREAAELAEDGFYLIDELLATQEALKHQVERNNELVMQVQSR